MPRVHWLIQENQGGSDSVRRVVQALESDRHVAHLVWLTENLDVPPIPDLAENLVSRWSPADVYCIDLVSSGDRTGVVEANCFNASRFYGSGVERILWAVNKFVLSRQ